MEGVVHTKRFEVVRRLGAGATGIVYEAHNRRSGERVALKALSRLDATSLYRFKREFRALLGVSHPNLVTLNELFHEGGRWFLSMELVQGMSFVEYVRRGRGEPDMGRARAALAQLVYALSALHEAGRLHRDIKPSNVLVTEQGRVVVLDFGFVRELDGDASAESVEILGTPAYMAPEQADAGAVAASDWYAVGVMLFEALTGKLPFAGEHMGVLLEKLERAAPRASSLFAGVPPDLDQLCAELLARDPRKRPVARALLERVGEALSERVELTPNPDVFVGRGAILAQLHAALERARVQGEPRLLTLTGVSAVGKSALLDRFANEVSERGAWVLFGRCHERENVPYKALDGIVDALVRRLSELSEVELSLLLPRYLGALTLQFPVLLRVPAIALQTARYVRPAEPHELRRQAAAALQELLARIADHHVLVLLIDDLQWGDVDSVHMLRDALSPEDMPGLLLVAAHRFDERVTTPALLAFRDAVHGLRRRGQFVSLRLEPLEESEAIELAHKLLGPLAHDTELLQHVVRESERVPLFVQELARHVVSGGRPNATLGELVEARVARLSQPARNLLEVLAVASAPLPIAVARELVGSSEFESLVRELLHERLVLMAAHPSENLDTRHDQIRTIIKRTLPAERAAEYHLTLARLLAAHGADPELLAHHFSSAGDPARAASYAARAAEAAAGALAFASAARCFELALAWGSFSRAERAMLKTRLAQALANAGRGRDAGEAYLGAAECVQKSERFALRSRAVDQLLRAGYIEPGLALGDELLSELGLSRAQTGSRALAGLLARRAWLFLRGYEYEPREPARVDTRALMRVEAARSMSLALGHMDPFAAANMQARHLMLALRSGDTFSVSRALGYEAVYLAIEGAPQSERALSLLERQRDLRAEPVHPYLRAFGDYARGVVEWGRGHWGSALACLEGAELGYRRDCLGANWEILAAQLFSLGCLLYLGRYDELRRRVLRTFDEARARDDRLTLQWIFAWQAIVDLLRGELPAAKQAIMGARARLPENRYTLPHLFVLFAATAASLYAGDGRGAHARITREWPAIKRSQILRMQVYRIELMRLRVAASLSYAESDPSAAQALHQSSERDLRRIEEEGVPWASAIALALRGELQRQQNLPRLAAGTWELSLQRLRAANMEGHAAAVSRALGLLVAGDHGSGLVAEADDWYMRRGVAEPARAACLTLGGQGCERLEPLIART